MGFYKGWRQEHRHQPLMQRLNNYSPPKNLHQASGIAKALSGLAEAGINVKAEDFAKLLPPDPMEPALTIMASVRAYIQGGSSWQLDKDLVER
jgi:hypothetical protein